jgi:hypothetical protein
MDATFPLKAGRRAFLSCILWASLPWRKPDPASAQSAVVRRLDPSAREILEAVVDAIVPRDRDPTPEYRRASSPTFPPTRKRSSSIRPVWNWFIVWLSNRGHHLSAVSMSRSGSGSSLHCQTLR